MYVGMWVGGCEMHPLQLLISFESSFCEKMWKIVCSRFSIPSAKLIDFFFWVYDSQDTTVLATAQAVYILA